MSSVAAADAPAIPITFITLDEDAARRERIGAEFDRLGLTATRLAATRWTRLSPEEQQHYYSDALNARTYFRPLVAGEKGCYASHIRAWRALLDSANAACVVLEDDVGLRDDFASVVSAIAALPPDWDMVKLIGRDNEKLRSSRPLVGDYRLVHYRRVPSLTAGYVVSRGGAAKLLASRVPFGRPIDVDLRHWWECGDGLRIAGVVPAAITLDDTSFQSSIGAKADDPGLARQWRKFSHKLHYSVHNALASARIPPP